MPWQPAAANAFRSAWIPAPPPESDVAIVRHVGTVNALSLRRHDPDQVRGCDLSPRGHPGGGDGTFVRVATALSSWDEMLQGEELAYLGTEASRPARTAPLPDGLDPRVAAALAGTGITELYAHQAEAWEAAARGRARDRHDRAPPRERRSRSTCRCSTRSPPSRRRRALYLYPTKALAQDQARALGELAVPKLRPAIYDGDTPSERRWQIRKWANLILTNPDMLHIGVLPRHDLWGDVLHNLRYVVVDEAHVYRGVFGSHVANVLRRLRRLARIYGAEPQFLLASATIANPGELAHSLLGVDATVIGDDARRARSGRSRSGTRRSLDAELGLRASALGEASRLLAALVSARAADDLLREEPQGGRADPPLRRRSGSTRRPRSGSRRTAPATRRSSGARSSGGSSRASCSASPRPTRSSSGSTSACSTARSRSASPARSRASASSGAAPAAAGTASRCSSRARTRSTSTSCASRRRCSAAASRRRSSTTRTRACSTATSPPPRSRRRSTTPTARRSATRRSSARRTSPSCSTRRAAGSGRQGLSRRAGRAALGERRRVHRRRRDRRRACSASSSASARTRPCTRAPSTSTSASRTSSRELDLTAGTALVEPFRGDWYTQAKKETSTDDRRAAARRAALGLELSFGASRSPSRSSRTSGSRIRDRRDARDRPARPAADDVRDRGGLVRPRARAARRARRDADAALARSTRPSTR